MLEHVAEGPEVPADVVEDPVQNEPEATAVQVTAPFGEGVVASQAPVHPVVVGGVVAVRAGLQDRTEEDGVGTGPLDVVEPGVEAREPLGGWGVVVVPLGCAESAERVDVVVDRLRGPGRVHVALLYLPVGIWMA
ncbi:MAG TPA: hypothetical protein VNT60_08505 [Deinococcales bacterium]|nr:hypothetical protein [Deinococcales bacterium]